MRETTPLYVLEYTVEPAAQQEPDPSIEAMAGKRIKARLMDISLRIKNLIPLKLVSFAT